MVETSLPKDGDAFRKSVEDAVGPSLYRLTDGIPRKELNTMVSESLECETALEGEIKLLERALATPEADLTNEEKTSLSLITTSEITPPDRFFTLSALLGRLREPMATPLPPNAVARRQQQQLQPNKKKKTSGASTPTPGEERKVQQRLLERHNLLLGLHKNAQYTRRHNDPTQLLALWKRISNHKTSSVFRKPVNPKDAPGYTDRILFPIDLSLIRKMITAKIITSYSDLHQRIGLICHNCVKFNGRESDYGVVTRDFEAYVDECMVQTLMARTKSPPLKATTSTPPAENGA